MQHTFSRVHWFKSNPRHDWFNPHIVVLDSQYIDCGPVIFMPVSRIFDECAFVTDKIKFDYRYDSVCIAVKFSNDWFMHTVFHWQRIQYYLCDFFALIHY